MSLSNYPCLLENMADYDIHNGACSPANMQYSIIPASEVPLHLMRSWSQITKDSPLYCSPALRPEVFRTIGQFNANIFVGIEETPNGPSLFFPFERPKGLASFARPVPMCDYQAFIAPPEHPILISQLLQAWKVKTWIFEHLLGPPDIIAQTNTVISELSRRAVLRGGFDAYLAEMAEKGTSLRRNLMTKMRLLGRDHGDIQFIRDCRDREVLRTLLDWRSQRFNAGKSVAPWVRDTLDALFAMKTQDFSGVLSALYVGDQLAAAHFGIRADRTLYYWFPAFNPNFDKYSPGWLLIVLLLQGLQATGLDTLDFGPGGEKYKAYFANAGMPVWRGFVERPSVFNLGRATWRYTQALVRRSKTAGSLLRPVKKLVRRS